MNWLRWKWSISICSLFSVDFFTENIIFVFVQLFLWRFSSFITEYNGHSQLVCCMSHKLCISRSIHDWHIHVVMKLSDHYHFLGNFCRIFFFSFFCCHDYRKANQTHKRMKMVIICDDLFFKWNVSPSIIRSVWWV